MRFNEFAPSYSFMGCQYPLKDAKAAVIPVPYESTVSYRPGTRDGPRAMIAASRQVETYDIELDADFAARYGIHTLDEIEPDVDSPKKMVDRVQRVVSEVIGQKSFPVVFGGEHTISTGAVRALKKEYPDLSVLQIDAHADLRDEFEGSKYSHACVMRRIREDVKHVVQAGIRSLSKEEMDYIKKNRIEKTMHWGTKADPRSIIKGLSDHAYVSIDLDGLDPSIMPGVGTPEPGGLGWEQVLGLLRAVGKKKKIVGFDVVELAPIPGSNQSEFTAAKLAYKMLGYSLFRK